MATTWAEIVTAALIQIDDVRLQEQMAVSPAQFYRRMSALIVQAMPLLSRPPELLAYLKNEMVQPSYEDMEWTSDEASTAQETQIDTGLTGFDLCSVTQRISHPNGTITLAPYQGASYDPETGILTMPVQESAGLNYDFDFYTDGAFPDLTETQMRLFALAVAVVWDERFSRNWLNMQMKIKDESFETVNEANYLDKVTKRLQDNRIAFNDELRWYEQICNYKGIFRQSPGRATLI